MVLNPSNKWCGLIIIMFHFIHRGRVNLRLLTKESLAVQADAAGKKFVYHVVD